MHVDPCIVDVCSVLYMISKLRSLVLVSWVMEEVAPLPCHLTAHHGRVQRIPRHAEGAHLSELVGISHLVRYRRPEYRHQSE